MIQSSHKLLGALLLVAAIGVGCHRAESDNPVVRPPVDYALQPIDLILKIQQNEEDQTERDPFIAPQLQSTTQDENQSVSITRTIATRSIADDNERNNYNIFLFHKTRDSIVRHYYVGYVNKDDIRLKNLYVGDYRIYIVVNNGRMCDHADHWGCTHRHTDMSNLMSSIIPLPQKSTDHYYSLMVYSDDDFRILHDNQRLEVKLKRLTSRIALNFVNTLSFHPGRPEHLLLRHYSIINMPRRARLFGDYRPMWQDVGQVTSYLISDREYTSYAFTVLNNMQGDGLAPHSAGERDRNSFNAPSDATCVRIYATHTLDKITYSNISYLIYVGGDDNKLNNYDMRAGVEYNYTITFKSPDFTGPNPDLRVASFTVPDEDKKFENASGSKLDFAVGEVISRPLTVKYSKLFANDSLFVSCIQSWPDTKAFKYNVYLREDEIYRPLYIGVEGASKTKIYVPTIKIAPAMDQVELKITYQQSVADEATLDLRLSTTNGQQYDVPIQKVFYK